MRDVRGMPREGTMLVGTERAETRAHQSSKFESHPAPRDGIAGKASGRGREDHR